MGKAPCSAGVDAFERPKDQYYTNFVIMHVPFFQSEHVRSFGKFMNEFYPGFFRYGWTDQLFFHKVMGLFLGPDFRSYVADYTDFRCKRYSSCWFPWAGAGFSRKRLCRAGGFFAHHKGKQYFGTFDRIFPNVTVVRNEMPYVSKYVHNCSSKHLAFLANTSRNK